MSRIIAVLAVAMPALVVFGIAGSFTRESTAMSRRAEWALRPEVENWADPYQGTAWLPDALSAGFVAFVVALVVVGLVTLVARRRGTGIA